MVTCEDPEKRAGVDYLVVWSLRFDDFNCHQNERDCPLTDYWHKFETWREAQAKYDEVLEDKNLYSAHIVVPVKSTDYDTSNAQDLYVDRWRTDPRYWQCHCEDHYIRDKHVVLHCDGCGMDSDECPDALVADIVDLFWKLSRRLEDQDKYERQLGTSFDNWLKVSWDGGIGGGR